MTLDTINEKIKFALVYNAPDSKNLWRSIKAKAAAIAKEKKVPITEEICNQAIKKELKELEQTLATVPEDSELAEKTKAAIFEIEFYLPKQPTDEELEQRIKGIVMAMPGGSPFGLMMKECMKELKDVADGKRISKILKSL